MAEELLSLKWNNHQAHFMDILAFLREQEIFVDITLACGGKLYPAHKFVLSTCSEYFKQMFIKNPTKHPIVFMKDVSSKDLEALLDFMYNGEVNVPQSCLGSLIKTAEGLQIKGLAVPDDPPLPKETAREKRERELKHSLDRDRSPPPKRQKPRDKSPISSSKNSLRLSPSPRVGSDSSNKAQADANLDEDSRTSVHSGVSGHSEQSSQNPSLNVNSSNNQLNSDRPPSLNSSENVPRNSKDEPSPGPSGLHPHKEEQVEIKQEDVVDLGDEDEGGDWGSGMAGMGDPDGLGDSSLGSDQNPSFPDLMLPHGESSMSTNADPAMWKTDGAEYTRASFQASLLANFLPKISTSAIADACSSSGSTLDSFWSKNLNSLTKISQPNTSSSDNKALEFNYPEKTWKCEYCDKMFGIRYYYERHMKCHSSVKEHKCPFCSFMSTYKWNLKSHIRSKHPEQSHMA